MYCNFYNERKIMIIFCLFFLIKDNILRYGYSKKFCWLFFFLDVNVFFVFLIIYVYVYNYEKLLIFICLLEMMLVVYVEFFIFII